jgi:hypothetical protein
MLVSKDLGSTVSEPFVHCTFFDAGALNCPVTNHCSAPVREKAKIAIAASVKTKARTGQFVVSLPMKGSSTTVF